MLAHFKKKNFSGELRIFTGVKGLVSHGSDLKDILRKETPKVILLSISPEEVDGLWSFIRSPFEMNLSDYEVIYGVRLSKYGEVMTPPPIYTEAITYAVDNNSEVDGIDMPQADFDELYTTSMKSRHLIRHSLRKKRILNRDYNDTNEYEFADAWIKKINSVKGLAEIDKKRALFMTDRIEKFAMDSFVGNHLIILDYEFYKPVVENLNSTGWVEYQA